MAVGEAKRQPGENRETDAGVWRAVDDNRLPNPEYSVVDADERDDTLADTKQNNTKVIMAHELRENPEGFKAMAEAVADSYNEAHALKVGEELPEQLKKEKT